MNDIVEYLTEKIDKKLEGYGSVDRISIISELRDHLEELEHEAMMEEYQLEPDFF
jgi:hypothetical protein